MNEELDYNSTSVFYKPIMLQYKVNGLVILSIPAWVCRQCGHRVLDGFSGFHYCTSYLN